MDVVFYLLGDFPESPKRKNTIINIFIWQIALYIMQFRIHSLRLVSSFREFMCFFLVVWEVLKKSDCESNTCCVFLCEVSWKVPLQTIIQLITLGMCTQKQVC
jgi:hypothetical protein